MWESSNSSTYIFNNSLCWPSQRWEGFRWTILRATENWYKLFWVSYHANTNPQILINIKLQIIAVKCCCLFLDVILRLRDKRSRKSPWSDGEMVRRVWLFAFVWRTIRLTNVTQTETTSGGHRRDALSDTVCSSWSSNADPAVRRELDKQSTRGW